MAFFDKNEKLILKVGYTDLDHDKIPVRVML